MSLSGLWAFELRACSFRPISVQWRGSRIAPSLVLAPLVVIAGLEAGRQDPAPIPGPDGVRFRVDSYSSLYEVRVFDAAGGVVSGLGREDVELLVDSHPTPLLLWEEQKKSQVSLAILLDLGSSMDEAAVRAAKQAVFELIHLLGPEDEILLAVYNRKVEFLAELTADRPTLVDALNNVTVGARVSFWKRLAQGFGTGSLTGSAIDEALLRLKSARHPQKMVLVFSAAFGNLGRGTLDHLKLAGARFFGIGWKNRLGDAFGLGGDRMAPGGAAARVGRPGVGRGEDSGAHGTGGGGDDSFLPGGLGAGGEGVGRRATGVSGQGLSGLQGGGRPSGRR